MRNRRSKPLIYTCKNCGQKGYLNIFPFQQEIGYLVKDWLFGSSILRYQTVYACSERCNKEISKKNNMLSILEKAKWLGYN